MNIFWNQNEHRPRAFWRILLQAVIFLAVMLLSSILVGVAVAGIVAAGGADVTDPRVIAGINSHPLARAGGALSSLGAMFLSYWIAARWLDRRPFRGFGFHFNRGWWVDLGFGLFLGAFLMLIIFLVELSQGWVAVTGTMQSSQPGVGFWSGILVSVIVYLCVGIYEEMLSRGYQLRNMAEGLNFKGIGPRGALVAAYLVSSSIFGYLHLGNPNSTWISTINLIIAGLFLGLGFVLTGELAIPIGLHITWNFFQGSVFGFPVSGGASAASFIAVEQGGPVLWTGGAFGPEAGLVGLMAMLLGSLLTVWWVRFRQGQASLKDSLAIYTPRESERVIAPQPARAIQDGG